MVEIDECSEWLFECRIAFPKLKNLTITCDYAALPEKALGRIKGKVRREHDIDAEELLLSGKVFAKTKKSVEEEFVVQINEKLKNIGKQELRKQAVQYIIIHELLHAENKDLLTLSKSYGRRKTKKIHVKSFDEETLGRFNIVREAYGLPKIPEFKSLEAAVNKLYAECLKK